MAAAKLASGSWAARWGEWQVNIRQGTVGWTVLVWHWPDRTPLGNRTLLGKSVGLRDSEAAIGWACSLLKEQGARVFVSGREQPLSMFLSFTPAPEAV